MFRPLFTTDILPGIDLPDTKRAGTIRWGLTTMYSRNPLVLYEFDTELGPVVANRVSTSVGLSVDITRAFTARMSLPFHAQWGSQVPRYAADGAFLGDLGFGARWSFYRKPSVGLGVRADLAVPTSQRGAYAGEKSPRMHASFLAMFDAGRVRFATDLGMNVRFRDLTTTEDLKLGSELVWNNGLRVNILPDKLAAGLSIYSRFGISNFFGAAESSGEAMATVGYRLLPIMWLNVGAGRGFTKGYGSSDFRGYLELAFQRVRPPKEDPDAFVDTAAGEGGEKPAGLQFNVRDIGQIRGDNDADNDEPEWAEGELARVESERIRIRQAIRFRVGSEDLLPESYPILDYMAALMNSDARIAHVVIEGHSSEDGDVEPNYRLSLARAGSIWKRLVEQGVHPARLSFRAMGEVMPSGATGEYTQLEASRRAVFHIARQYEEWEEPPAYVLDLRFPWNGDEYRAVQPKMPSPDEVMNIPELMGERTERSEDDLKDIEFETDDEESDIEFDDTDDEQDVIDLEDDVDEETSSSGDTTPDTTESAEETP
jgi:outer membrane protein OmpA-like peptidoglycan-associated protein